MRYALDCTRLRPIKHWPFCRRTWIHNRIPAGECKSSKHTEPDQGEHKVLGPPAVEEMGSRNVGSGLYLGGGQTSFSAVFLAMPEHLRSARTAVSSTNLIQRLAILSCVVITANNWARRALGHENVDECSALPKRPTSHTSASFV